MAALTTPEAKFKKTLGDLLDLVESVIGDAKKRGAIREDVSIISTAVAVLRPMPPQALADLFVKHSYPFWSQIRSHEETFFTTNASKIFGNLPGSNISLFKNLVGNPNVCDTETKEGIWEYFEVMVKLSIRYVQKARVGNPGCYREVDVPASLQAWRMAEVAAS
jgi:hypothetical protein